ncbi:MAG TPA: rod shape-determining protein MreD [Firmicutes bacterium]|nr:rod shape-determining protein MreD [Bacillota bacterium]
MPDNEPIGSHNPMPKLGHRYLKWTAYGLILLLALLLQSAPRLFPEIAGGRPVLLIPLAVAIAMCEGPVGGAAAGVAAGLLWDLFSDRLLGFNALILMALCCAAGLLIQLLMRNNLLSFLMLIAGTLAIQGILDLFFNHILVSQAEPAYVLLHLLLPNAVYTLVLSPLLYGAVYGISRLLRRRE